MNNLEKYLDRVIAQKAAGAKVPQALQVPRPPIEQDLETEPSVDVAGAMLRRWYIVLLTFLILTSVGIPSIWLLIQRKYVVSGAIKVAPIIPNIITGEADRSHLSNYQSFMYTQAEMLTSPPVIQKVSDDLSPKGLSFFEERTNTLAAKVRQKLKNKEIRPEPFAVLKQAVLDGMITAEPVRRAELIKVSMTWPNASEAKRIVDSFIRNYMALEVNSATQEEERQLAILEDEQKVLAGKIENYLNQIGQLAKEFGSKDLASRYDMNLQRVGSLLKSLTEVEARRIYLQAQIKAAEEAPNEPIPLEDRVTMRENYVNKDPIVTGLTANIVALEQALVAAKQALTPTNPQIKQKEELLEALRSRLEEQKAKAREDFSKLMEEETASISGTRLKSLKAQLEQTKAHEKELRELLAQEDARTVNVGQKDLAMQDLQYQLTLTKDMHDQISRRIQEFRMERKRPARISVAYNADISEILDKRVKYTAALLFVSLALGAGLALLRDKADRSLRTPDDVVKRIGLRIIGTTTSSETVEPAYLPEQVAGEFQAIRANLGMLDGNGMPRTIVVTSPGMREGKTTVATNLAISVSRSGKRVLLIDGDLRNPQIASLLGLPKGLRSVQDVLFAGKDFSKAVSTLYSSGSAVLDVLAADARNRADAFELLTSPLAAQRLNQICQEYDHVIVDTPPVLAFADALVWAKYADGVILTCFAGLTTGPNLNKAKERLAQIDARVLGTVVSNVEPDDSYHPYGYHYYPRTRSRGHARRVRSKMLLPVKPKDTDQRKT